MERLVECVPNFSEGQKPETVARLARAIESVESAIVLDTHMDADHNRSVITFVAVPERVVEAALRAVALAAELIDLRLHVGEHPRVGATDVLPFVPVRGVTMAECVALAHAAGERIAAELGIPVYFYERAALRPDRANLEDVRRKGFEQLRAEIGADPARAPDIGAARLHESAGAVIVGARPFLIAYNINLHTDDVLVARRIARAVRGRDGGLRYLKALGFMLAERSQAQVSMNLVNYELSSLHHAFEAVRREAERYGVRVASSELVGLVPQTAIERAAEFYLQMENFTPDAVIENRIASVLAARQDDRAEQAFVAEAASDRPAPGGGAAAARSAALGAALGEMMASLTERQEKFADVAGEVRDALQELKLLREQLEQAAHDDAASFRRVVAARRAARADEGEARAHANEIEAALKGAATVPVETAGLAVQVLELLETIAEIGDPRALSDTATGAQLALAATVAARYNVLVNTAEIEDDEFNREHRARADDLLARAREIAARIEALLLDSIAQ